MMEERLVTTSWSSVVYCDVVVECGTAGWG